MGFYKQKFTLLYIFLTFPDSPKFPRNLYNNILESSNLGKFFHSWVILKTYGFRRVNFLLKAGKKEVVIDLN